VQQQNRKKINKRPNKENRTWNSEYMHTRDRIIRSKNNSPWHKWKIYHDIHRRFTMTYKEDSPW